MLKLLKDLITGFDNETADIAPITAACISLTYVGLAIYDVVWHGKAFDMQAFGIGAGAVIGAVGVALGLKNKWEANSGAKQ
jgi:O-antigen ligase